MKHLVITTASIPKESCLTQLGYNYEIRERDYIDSFKSALKFKDLFDSITIIETISREKVDYLENSGINVYYSNFDNSFVNKGLNEMFHIRDFIENNNIDDNDLVVKLSGRYIMENDNILSINSDFIAKYDGDIYDPINRGVHTFFFAFIKKSFVEFINSIDINVVNSIHISIEWVVKEFLLKKNIKILDSSYKLGVTTCLYNKFSDIWTRIYC